MRLYKQGYFAGIFPVEVATGRFDDTASFVIDDSQEAQYSAQTGGDVDISRLALANAEWDNSGYKTFSGDRNLAFVVRDDTLYCLTDNEQGEGHKVIRASHPISQIALRIGYGIDRPSVAFFFAGAALGLTITMATLINTPPAEIFKGQFTNLLAIACMVGVLGAGLWNAHKYVEDRGGVKNFIREVEEGTQPKAKTVYQKDEELKSYFGSNEFARLLHSREFATMVAMLVLVGTTCAIASAVSSIEGVSEGVISLAMLGMVACSVCISNEVGREIKAFIDQHDHTGKGRAA